MKVVSLFAMKFQGGAETLALDVFRNGASHGIEFTGVYRHRGVMGPQFEKCGVPLFHLPFRRRFLRDFLQLRRLLRRNHIEILHAHQPLDALIGIVACAGLGVKTVFTVHGYDFDKRGLSKLMVRVVLRFCDLTVFVSDTQARYYVKNYKIGQGRHVTIYNGIDTGKFDNFTVSSLRRELSLGEDVKLIGSVGNFVPVRNHLSVCCMVKALADRGRRNVHCVLIGKKVDAYEDIFNKCVEYCERNGISDMVSFLGYRADIPGLLSQLDAFVYSTDFDTFGIAVIEAIASGVPVVVNSEEVMNEVTENGRLASLYRTGDIEEFADKVSEVLDNGNASRRKALESSGIVRDKYSIDSHLRRLHSVYTKLLSGEFGSNGLRQIRIKTNQD